MNTKMFPEAAILPTFKSESKWMITCIKLVILKKKKKKKRYNDLTIFNLTTGF